MKGHTCLAALALLVQAALVSCSEPDVRSDVKVRSCSDFTRSNSVFRVEDSCLGFRLTWDNGNIPMSFVGDENSPFFRETTDGTVPPPADPRIAPVAFFLDTVDGAFFRFYYVLDREPEVLGDYYDDIEVFLQSELANEEAKTGLDLRVLRNKERRRFSFGHRTVHTFDIATSDYISYYAIRVYLFEMPQVTLVCELTAVASTFPEIEREFESRMELFD